MLDGFNYHLFVFKYFQEMFIYIVIKYFNIHYKQT